MSFEAYTSGMALIENKKARLNYEILEQFEAGISLSGYEVKALRSGLGKLEGSHVVIRGKEGYVVGMHVPPYQVANAPESYDPTRSRKLLLTKKELVTLGDFEGQKGLTIVPLRVYNKGPHLKLLIAVVRGRKKYDKREVLKKRDTEREMQRTLKRE